jgi:hypothetical protein
MAEHFKVGTSVHGLPCIELVGGNESAHAFLRRSVTTQWTNDPAYIAKQGGHPFLQGQDRDWTLVEFWGRDYAPFVAYLNDNYNPEG